MTPQAFAYGATMFRFFPDLGRRAMIDFGLSGLLDRIERDFGKRAAKVLTVLIGLTIACACFSVIGTVLSGAWTFALGVSEDTSWLRTALYAVGLITQLLALVLVPSVFANLIEQRHTNAALKRELENGRLMVERVELKASELERRVDEARQKLFAAPNETEPRESR